MENSSGRISRPWCRRSFPNRSSSWVGRDRDRIRVLLSQHGHASDRRRNTAADLPVEDAEIAAHARKRFEKQGIEILTSTKVTKVEKKPDGVAATIEDANGVARTLEAERMIPPSESLVMSKIWV